MLYEQATGIPTVVRDAHTKMDQTGGQLQKFAQVMDLFPSEKTNCGKRGASLKSRELPAMANPDRVLAKCAFRAKDIVYDVSTTGQSQQRRLALARAALSKLTKPTEAIQTPGTDANPPADVDVAVDRLIDIATRRADHRMGTRWTTLRPRTKPSKPTRTPSPPRARRMSLAEGTLTRWPIESARKSRSWRTRR